MHPRYPDVTCQRCGRQVVISFAHYVRVERGGPLGWVCRICHFTDPEQRRAELEALPGGRPAELRRKRRLLIVRLDTP